MVITVDYLFWARPPAGEKWNADDADEADNYDFKMKSVLILLNLCYLCSIILKVTN